MTKKVSKDSKVSKNPKFRKNLNIGGMLKTVRKFFGTITDQVKRKSKYSLVDCLMSGIAIFSFKYPSLLQFDKDSHSDPELLHNMQQLFKVKNLPSDTTLRERLDVVEPKELQGAIDKLIAKAQRDKVLDEFKYLLDKDEKPFLLVAIDGTTYFSSNEIHCDSCLVKNHKNGTIEYHHQMLTAVIVSPTLSEVLPIMLEPILKQDGTTKNDCEINALKRLLVNLRTKHPHLKICVLLDALFGSYPVISLLKELDLRYIINVKPGDTKSSYLFDAFTSAIHKNTVMIEKPKKKHCEYVYHNNLPLNAIHYNKEVHLLTLKETKIQSKKSGGKIKITNFSWITDLKINDKNADAIGVAGRRRWGIENETFNTLKNACYGFEHNYGHGYKNLSVVMTYLMFTVFLINQLESLCCSMFQAAREAVGSTISLWEKLRGLFFEYVIESWSDMYLALAGHRRRIKLSDMLNTT